ncbi:Golgi-associated plant pathogenesis-related protein 1 [Elysia marginata]|uniref:Golgi-associated plant pathogenesis-related protein 1 n=1 Tax=Elysia marginata TaxID=1093978 RepID=A0AAV4JY11_9GAST|nr:Golgi-associated plant pathogenesis-related protein 1 [Elysia marginata]
MGCIKSKQSSGGAPATDLKGFRDEALKAHNDRRKKHGVPPLKLNDELNKYAQDWADHLVKTGTFQHSNCTLSNGDRLGENIANAWSSAGADFTGEEVTQNWYSEISKHDYKSEQSMGTGHFTQVVWKDSKELGMGKAKSTDGKVFVVGSYRPAGNFIGKFTENVFPPK